MKYYLKKAILFVLIAVLSLIIIGCGKKETPDNSGKKCTIMVECSKIFDNQDKLDKWDYAISISSGAKQHHLRDFTHHPNIVG